MTQTGFNSDRYGPKRSLRFLKAHYRWQRDAPPNTPLRRRVTMLRQGYSAAGYRLLGLPRDNMDDYLPEIARLDNFFINGPFAREILNDKLRFVSLLQDSLPMPKTLALIERGQTYVLGESEVADIVALAHEHGSVIIKPASSSHGHGVYRLEVGPELKLNGRSVSTSEVKALITKLDDCLVSEAVRQAAYAREICPETTNTVRILTYVDADTNEPFVAHAFHRFGTVESNPIDNWSGGGLLAACTVETGVLGPSFQNPKRTGGKMLPVSHHPDTGSQIEGVRIPGWDEMCQGVLAAVRAFPFLIYVGWDVAMTDEGFIVIEGNNNTDLIMQMHGGLLRNPRVRRFYQHHGVI